MKKLQFFKEDLEQIINRHSVENEWDMPDFLMAEFIAQFIISAGPVMKKNLDWHGTDSVCHPKAQEECGE